MGGNVKGKPSLLIYIYIKSYKLEACNYALFLLIVAVVKASVVHTAAENATFPTLD